MQMDPEAVGHYFKMVKQRYSKCLEPRMSCANEAIRAHSIQNAKVLDLLVERDHVIGFALKRSKDAPPRSEFRLLGRNEASTFTGLCTDHDGEIFRLLDTKPLVLSNREQLFLIAWRSVTRELHVTMAAAHSAHATLTWGVETKRTVPSEDSYAVQEATKAAIKSYGTYLYRRENYDLPLVRREFAHIHHDVVTLSHAQPTLAVSALFSIHEIEMNGYIPRVVLNVIPIDTRETAVILSYTSKDRRRSKNFLEPILKAKGEEQKLAISRLVIGRVENFVLAPTFFNTWSEKRRQAVTDAFEATLYEDGIAPASSDAARQSR